MRLLTVIMFFSVTAYSQNHFSIYNIHLYENDNLPGRNIFLQGDTNLPKTSSKSPGGAALRSALLPGLGQIYNHSYWKVPIIYGLGAYCIYQYARLDKKFDDYAARVEASKNEYYPQGNSNLKAWREYYRDYRDSFVWYLGLLYLVNILDAYIDAHLFDFDVDNISSSQNQYISAYWLKFKVRF